MGAIADLWNSERGILLVIFAIGATVLTALGRLTPEQWVSYTQFMFVTYAAAKTVTGGIAMMTGKSNEPSAPVTTAPAPATATPAPAATAPAPAATTVSAAPTTTVSAPATASATAIAKDVA